jgi:hypothetical protein
MYGMMKTPNFAFIVWFFSQATRISGPKEQKWQNTKDQMRWMMISATAKK